jgi:hypothetical protein
MKTALVLGMLLVASVGSAYADPRGPATEPDGATVDAPPTPSSLDINLELGLKGFRFGTRLFGRHGYAGGAWLNGETRPDGFSLDGRLEHDGKTHNFKFNADLDEWVRRAVRAWGVTDL